jgi:hypothetical protein
VDGASHAGQASACNNRRNQALRGPVIATPSREPLRRRPWARLDDQIVGEGVVLGVRVAERHQGTVGLGEEGRQDIEQELLLQLAHVGVEPPVGLAVPLDVEDTAKCAVFAVASATAAAGAMCWR